LKPTDSKFQRAEDHSASKLSSQHVWERLAIFSLSSFGGEGRGEEAASRRPAGVRLWTLDLGLWTLIPLLLVHTTASAGNISLTEPQRAKLASLVSSQPEAKKLSHKLVREADANLAAPGQPITRLGTAARLSDDPIKIESHASLEDMKRLEALGNAYAITGKNSYRAAARHIILRWAEINQPTGVPIDETKLEPLFFTYDLVRASCSEAEQRAIDGWLRRIAALEIQSGRTNSITSVNNWNSHRLKTIGLIGFLLDDKTLIDESLQGFKKQIDANLRPDGSSLDFHQRDALHYHCYDLEPLLTLAIAADQNGVHVYHYQSPSGASLAKSVEFLLPYCDGRATHAEWVHSKVKFDRQRAEAGEKGFVVGAPFDPQEARHVLELAAFFEPRFLPALARLCSSPGTATRAFPTWQTVLNEARRSP